MMLNRCILSSSWRVLPLVVAQRFRVRNLPKESFGEHESYYVRDQKPGKTYTTEVIAFVNRKNFTIADIKNWRKWKKVDEMKEDQKYIPERHQILGPNLATAHFICARGGKVKFKGSAKWTTPEDIDNRKIPESYTDGYYIEEIDASGTNLCYEGFENLCNLTEFKKLILQNCEFVDDWSLSRSHLFERSLQYLDLSGCKNVTERGICALHPLKELKTLILHDTPKVQHKELVSLLLQDVIPNVEILGVDLNDPNLLKRVESFMIS